MSTHRFNIFTRSAFVVRSIDLIMTRVLGVTGVLASLSGLKLRTVLMILLEMEARVRIRVPSELSVAVTSKASLSKSVDSSLLWVPELTSGSLAGCSAAGPKVQKPPLRGWMAESEDALGAPAKGRSHFVRVATSKSGYMLGIKIEGPS